MICRKVLNECIELSFHRLNNVFFQTVEEVGEAMMTSLKIDKNGTVLSVMPDSPLIEYPNYKTTYGYLVMYLLTDILRVGHIWSLEVLIRLAE